MEHQPLKPMLLDLLSSMQAAQHILLMELSDADREAIGTLEHWSARDLVAHCTFWKQRFLLNVAAIARGETLPPRGDIDSLNAQAFEEQRQRPWSDILFESERTHAEFITRLQSITEEQLGSTFQFIPNEDDGVFPEGRPLWDLILGNGYWHPQSHLIQFYLDHHDVAGATRMQETLVSIAVQRGVLPAAHGILLYNLACFYASTGQIEKALAVLQEALLLNPNLTTLSKQDPDLATLPRE